MILPLKYVRLFLDSAGRSHFKDCLLPLETRPFAPPTTPLETSELMPATGFAVVHFAPTWEGPWHPSPYPQWFFILSGSITITAGNGTQRTLEAGAVILLNDSGSKGHLTRVNHGQPVIAVGVRLSESLPTETRTTLTRSA